MRRAGGAINQTHARPSIICVYGSVEPELCGLLYVSRIPKTKGVVECERTCVHAINPLGNSRGEN